MNEENTIHVHINRPIASFYESITTISGTTFTIGRNFTVCDACGLTSIYNAEDFPRHFQATEERPEISQEAYLGLLRVVKKRPYEAWHLLRKIEHLRNEGEL